jgi:glutamate dehydrogenase/leucine dehydrogenase
MGSREPQLVIMTGRSGACVVIDSIVNHTSSGGVRITEDISLSEVKTLAREMTLKCSFFGLPRGGAKSGIRVSSDTAAEEKKGILEDFGRSISPIVRAGIYYPGVDMGCSTEELRTIYGGTGVNLGKLVDTSYFTALSVADAIRAWRESAKPDRNPLDVAIEGFGRVASHLVERLPENDYRIIAVSTVKGAVINENGFAVKTLLAYRREFGDDLVGKIPDARPIQKEEVLTAEVDVLIPSARAWTINQDNAGRIGAHVIAPIANSPYTETAIGILHEKGIVCLPGFVTNSGGVFASSLFENGMRLEEIERISATYYKGAVKSLLRRSEQLKLPPAELAETFATKRFEMKKGSSDTLYGRMASAGFDRLPFLRTFSATIKARQIVDSLRGLSAEIESC